MSTRIALVLIALAVSPHASAQSEPPSEDAFRKLLRVAREARESGESDDEITQLRTAYVMAVQLQLAEGVFQSTMALDQVFKDSDKPMERAGALRSGSGELKKLGGDKSLWAAQVDVALAVALEDQSKRGDAAATAKRAVAVLETLGPKSREYRETLRMLATMFEEDGNASVASEFIAKYNAIEQARESEPLFGFQADPKLRQLIQRLRATVARPQNMVEVQWTLGQIASAAEKIDMKSPYRARALAEAAATCLAPKRKLDSKVSSIAEGYLRKAIDLHDRALESAKLNDTSQTSLEVLHFRDLQDDVTAVGAYYQRANEPAKQEDALKRGLAVAERVLGNDHPALAGPLRRLANFYSGASNKNQVKRLAEGSAKDDSRLDAAIGLVERELKVYEKAFGADDPILANTVAHLAQLLWMKGAQDRAKELDARGAGLREALFAAKTPEKNLQDEVRQLKAFLRFEDAVEQVETFKKLYPDKSATVTGGL